MHLRGDRLFYFKLVSFSRFSKFGVTQNGQLYTTDVYDSLVCNSDRMSWASRKKHLLQKFQLSEHFAGIVFLKMFSQKYFTGHFFLVKSKLKGVFIQKQAARNTQPKQVFIPFLYEIFPTFTFVYNNFYPKSTEISVRQAGSLLIKTHDFQLGEPPR